MQSSKIPFQAILYILADCSLHVSETELSDLKCVIFQFQREPKFNFINIRPKFTELQKGTNSFSLSTSNGI